MDLLPPIAAGRLEDCSVAELVASAFLANVTGTLVVEEGRAETRLYLRYGVPCGVERPSADLALVELLVEEGLVGRADAERTRQQASARLERHVDVLVQEGLLPFEQADRIAALAEWRKLLLITGLREGRYELRGWERPPPWTEGVSLDAFRYLVEALQTETLADRRRALVDLVGDMALGPSSDFDFLAGRVDIEPFELEKLRRTTMLGEAAVEEQSLVLAAVLLGFLESQGPDAASSDDFLDASFFLTPVPNESPFSESDSLELDFDLDEDGFGLDGVDLDDLASIGREEFRPTSPTGEDDLFSDIGDLVADLDEFMTGPISIVNEPTADGSDVLALAFARELEAAEEAVFESDEVSGSIATSDDDMALEMALESSVEELSGKVEISGPVESTPAPVEKSSPRPEVTAPSDASREDVRKRLLQRAFKNLGGSAFRRGEPALSTPAPVRPPPPPAQRRSDPAFERDLQNRLALRGEDHFKRLGVSRTAGEREIKNAFLELAKRFHPDKVSPSAQDLQPLVREVFGLVKDSYDVLIDPAARARYLATLQPDEQPEAKHDPKLALAAFQRAKTILARQDLVNAEPELARAVAFDPRSEYLAELAWTLYSNKLRRDTAHDEIRALVRQALETKPVHDRALVVAAYVARVDGEADHSETLFRKALAMNPANAVALSEVRLLDSRKKRGLFRR